MNKLYAHDDQVGPFARMVLDGAVWCAAGRFGATTILNLLFEATDIEQVDFFVRAIEHDASLSRFFRMIAREKSLLRLFDLGGESRIVNWFAKQLV